MQILTQLICNRTKRSPLYSKKFCKLSTLVKTPHQAVSDQKTLKIKLGFNQPRDPVAHIKSFNVMI